MYIAYIDPGTGSMLISAAIAMLSVVFFTLKDKIFTLFSNKGEKGEFLDTNRSYGLVYYSEGKQYWNVFKPLLEEGSNRNLEAVYLTSDKEDPGLSVDIDGVKSIYIGTGREAYYKLNRLKADMVIMTTPGLDVLEIKRSKEVKHYSHITHATGSTSGYKAFATDYFDSVLVGGQGVVEVIRELEAYRNLPEKDIEVIGHTYLDELRENLNSKQYEYTFFKEKRETVLISPTWGNHGLLTKYGNKLLSELSKNNQYNIIVRPHPQSFVSDKELIDGLMKSFPNSESLIWDQDRDNLKAMSHADVMISDFSSITFDFFVLFQKPILTMHAQYDKRGREAMDLENEPWDLDLLNKIGVTLSDVDFNHIELLVEKTLKEYNFSESQIYEVNKIANTYPGESKIRGLDYIEGVLEHIQDQKNELKTENIAHINEDFRLILEEHIGFTAKLMKLIKNTSFLFELSIASILLNTYLFIGARIFPSFGLNYEYITSNIKYYVFYISIVPIILLYLNVLWKKGKATILLNKLEKPNFNDFLLISLPLAPIAQYIISNQDILGTFDSFMLLLIFMVISISLLIIVPTLLSPFSTKKFTVPVTLAFSFIVFNMASFGRTTPTYIVNIVFISIVLFSLVLFWMNKKNLLIIISLVFLVVNTTTSITKSGDDENFANEDNSYEESAVVNYLDEKELKKTPDIYLLIYDAYSNEETLNQYGFDNSDQMNYLLDKGFAIYDGTYSIGSASLISMSQVLNIGRLKNAEEYRRNIAGSASGLQVLRNNDYDSYLLTGGDYMTKGFDTSYTSVYPSAKYSIKPYKIIYDAILEGEFRFDAEFSTGTRDTFLKAKSEILKNVNENPEFMYQHSSFPGHSQNSGVLRDDETELHIESLLIANEEIKKDLSDLDIDNSDAIVIIAGDHGPYLTKNGIGLGGEYDISEVNRLDIQDRFGAFLAIHWPDKSYATRYNIETIQDVLPAVFSYMYQDDKIFEEIKLDNKVAKANSISGVSIENGMIVGGIDDGKPLFEINEVRLKKTSSGG